MSIFLSPPPAIEQPVVVAEDNGGLVHEYQRAVVRYNNENRRVEIRGACRSACTLALDVKNVCVGKGAIVKWHHAFNTITHEPRYDVTQEMLRQIPFKIAQTVRPYISIAYNPAATLTHDQLVALGVADCDAPGPATTASAEPAQPPTGQTVPAHKTMTEAETRALFSQMMGKLPAPVDVAAAPRLVVRRPVAPVRTPARPADLIARTAARIAYLPVAFFDGFARGLHRQKRIDDDE